MTKDKQTTDDTNGNYELESHLILRLPHEPAKTLRLHLQSGATQKDFVTVKIENDLRKAEVTVGNWFLPGKIVDFPTIIESLKTLDSKNFYKTADISQMLICNLDEDSTPDENIQSKTKQKKDPNKVEKKYLWPHGLTPPVKNVRKCRFRKTLRKKYAEGPEVEKEVKRLLTVDNEAVNVKWEVINEEDLLPRIKTEVVVKKEHENDSYQDNYEEMFLDPEYSNESNSIATQLITTTSSNVEHDIFGGPVSDSDDEETKMGDDVNNF